MYGSFCGYIWLFLWIYTALSGDAKGSSVDRLLVVDCGRGIRGLCIQGSFGGDMDFFLWMQPAYLLVI